MHKPLKEISENSALEIAAEIVSDEKIQKVEVWFQNGNTYESAELQRKNGYTWTSKVPENLLKNGFLEYHIIVSTPKTSFTFPAGAEGNPGEWDFYKNERYSTQIVPEDKPLYLFEAAKDSDYVVGQWLPGLNIVPTDLPGEAEYQVHVEQLFEEDIENLDANPIFDYSFRYYFRDKIGGRIDDLSKKSKLILKGRGLQDKKEILQVALIMKNGKSFGTSIELQPEVKEHVIDFAELQEVKTVTLPRPYPSFLPYYFDHNISTPLDLNEVESLQFSIGPGLNEDELKEAHGVGVRHVRLE